ncbi:MAG TPA: electron transport complex subunit RsxC [Gammaproteobacteria bacterium]|nr:electron transport complex subunit RsxC [Gammaproteobacteria bacterium]
MSNRAHRVWKFPGGLRLPPHKSASTAEPVATAEPPAVAVLPLSQHAGAASVPIVAAGRRVLAGEPVARANDGISAPLHAPTSGTILAIEDRQVPRPGGPVEPCVILEADGRDQRYEGYEPVDDPQALAPAEIRRLVHEAGIVGLGGAVFPAAVKLEAGDRQPLDTLILNGAECEPYISCDDMLMRERAAHVVHGAQIMLHALSARCCLVAVEHDKPEAIAALKAAVRESGDDRFEVVSVTTAYPAGGERQLIQVLSGREVPAGGLPPDIGYMTQNVGTAAAVSDRFRHGRPLISRVVTVAGGGVASPRNFDARLGTPFAALIAAAGGYTDEAARLVMGGPMMGFALPDDALPVVKATNCIWVAGAADLRRTDDEMPCIRCAECARVCPAVLLPQQLYWYTRARDFEKVVDYAVFDCIECGCCDLVCPSHIPLVSYFRYAKNEIRGRDVQRERAARAQRRHAERNRRLAQRDAEQQAALDEHTRAAQRARAQPREAAGAIDDIMRRAAGHEPPAGRPAGGGDAKDD